MEFKIVNIEQVDSTNKHILGLVESGECQEGLVVWADEQLAGRGHGDNIWESERGKNLTFSLVLRPVYIKPADQFIITKIISVAILHFLEKNMPSKDISIKWPNDIYIGEKKVGGILIQNSIKGKSIDYSIVGIGLNVNQTVFISDARNPVSIVQVSEKEYDLDKLLSQLLQEIGKQYEASVSSVNVEQLDKSYRDHLFRQQEWHAFSENGKYFRGMITGVGEYGRLQIKMADGNTRQFDFKEVEFVI